MKQTSSVKFVYDKNNGNEPDDKKEFAKFYNKLIKPQIDELASLIISSSAETQLETIEELTNSLFTNLEKLDSENLAVLNGYKVVSRSYFIFSNKRHQNNKFSDENNENKNEQNQNKINKFEKQNEEIVEKMTEYLEAQKTPDKSKQDITTLTKAFKQFKDNVDKVTNDIAGQLNLENISNINDLSHAITEYKNQKEQQINELNNQLKSLKEETSTENEKINLASSIKKAAKNSNEDISPNSSDFIQKEIMKTDPQQFEKEKRQLLNIISKKDELISELKNERDKLKSFVSKSIFSDTPNKNQNELNDSIKLKTDLNLLKVKYDKLNTANTKLKAKLKKFYKLESEVEGLKAQLKAKEEENQIKLSKLTVEKDQLLSQLSDRADLNSVMTELDAKSDQVKTLNGIINQLQSQLKEQYKEIAEENKIKLSLVRLVEKQSNALSEYERVVIDKMNTISSQETEKSKFNSILNAAKQNEKIYQNQFDELFENLIQIVNKEIEDKTVSDNILLTLKNHRPEDIVTTFQTITNQMKLKLPHSEGCCQNYSKSQIDKLFNYIVSIVNTLRTFVNKSEADTDKKNEILRECIYTDSFINENAPGLIEEPTIFDAFDINVDESLFVDQVTQFVNNFRDLETNQEKELFSILTYVIVMNTILRKTAFSYRDQCEIRTFEVKKLKNRILELQQNREFGYIMNEEEEEEEEAKNEQKKIKSKDVNVNQSQTKEPDQLKQQYLTLKENYDKSKKIYSSNINKYKKKVDFLTKQNNELRNKIDSHKSILSQASQISDESNTVIKSLKQEVINRDLELETSQEIIEKQREEIEKLKHSLLLQKENIKLKQKETIRKEKQNSEEFIQEIQNNCQNQIRKIQQQHKLKLLKLNDELTEEKNRYQTLKNKFDEIFDDLRNQLSESRSNEMKMKLEFSSKEAEITSLKGKLSALNVDNKMMKVKFANLEEKSSRERAFKANQTIAQQIAIEQQTTARVNEIEISMKNKEQLFLQSLCYILHDYVNENDTISYENVKLYLQKAMNDVKRLKNSLDETKIITNEIAKIRSIIKPPRTKSTSEAVQDLVNQRNDLSDTNRNKNNEEVKLNEVESNSNLKIWNSWARKVLTLATDITCAAKSDKELRNAIEEVIIQNSMIKSNRFVIESLRKQKKILLSKVPLRSPKKKNPSILSILVILSAIRRMQKLSGNLHSDLVIPNIIENDKVSLNQMKSKRKSSNKQKNYPLIISYE